MSNAPLVKQALTPPDLPHPVDSPELATALDFDMARFIEFASEGNPDNIRIISNQQAKRLLQYVTEKGGPDPTDLKPQARAEMLETIYLAGGTIALSGVERYESIGKLCGVLAAHTGVNADAYGFLSPPESLGLATHVDPIDRIVIGLPLATGIKGLKTITLQPLTPDQEAPFWERSAVFTATTVDRDLKGGRHMHLPKGPTHTVKTGKEGALHLNVGTAVDHEIALRIKIIDEVLRPIDTARLLPDVDDWDTYEMDRLGLIIESDPRLRMAAHEALRETAPAHTLGEVYHKALVEYTETSGR